MMKSTFLDNLFLNSHALYNTSATTLLIQHTNLKGPWASLNRECYCVL